MSTIDSTNIISFSSGVLNEQKCKTIILPSDNNKKEFTPSPSTFITANGIGVLNVQMCNNKKDKKDRVVTRDKKWTLCDTDYNPELQLNIMKESDHSNSVYNLMCCEIKRKISGYKSQDHKKNKYSEHDFIDMDFIKTTLIIKFL